VDESIALFGDPGTQAGMPPSSSIAETASADRPGERLARELALVHAVAREELYLHYQPQVDLRSGEVVGVEALVRWHNPVLGEIPPHDFIPMAERTGQGHAMGQWVLQAACQAAKRWHQKGLSPIRMAVNLHPGQMQQADIACAIESIVMKSGLDPHMLTIEVTEDMLMRDLDHAASTLGDLQSIGIQIVLDHFGTGYAGLACLRRLPVDVLKIDRALVPDVTASTEDVSILRAVIDMAHSLRMKVLALGVESDGELALLATNQCDQMQGMYFSAPLAESELIALLHAKRRLPETVLGRHARQRTLLVVDDEENIVASLRRLLRRDGYHIITAHSGQQGLQRLAENDVDVIISDQRMPGMTGVEFLRRAKELYPHTVRMVLSGYTELQSITDAINEGAIYKFLTKPWDDDRVRGHISEAFSHKEMADENRRLDREVQEGARELAHVNGQLKRLLECQREQIHREETSLVIAREVLENLPAPVIGLDQEGMIAFMNSDAEALFEGATGLLGQPVESTGSAALAALWHTRDGHHHEIELVGQRFMGVCRDMQGRAHARGSLMVLTPHISSEKGAS
jgi:EAL domain-containing protein (putative c-di-GMP-specific phosphodiesterase class I)/FixJ family two-component response regulator